MKYNQNESFCQRNVVERGLLPFSYYQEIVLYNFCQNICSNTAINAISIFFLKICRPQEASMTGYTLGYIKSAILIYTFKNIIQLEYKIACAPNVKCSNADIYEQNKIELSIKKFYNLGASLGISQF